MTTDARACPACLTPLPEAAHFCAHCGTATPTEPGVPPRTAATEVTEIARVRKALAGRGYNVDRILGEGGMATVYLATDVKHRRQVAVKVMRPDLAATLGAERFLREVEIAAQLSHPHILPVHDSGDADGVLYYVMPYVEGESLHERIRRDTQLPVDEALRIAREVVEALAFAHQRKIVHRDIKPGNIMLSAGHALVADFGIARAVGAGGGAAITKTGLAVGTPQYMSPEQASGSGAVDGRSDIFAMGCVLYEMLAGEPPFTGPTAQAIVMRTMTEKPRPLTSSREGLAPAIEAAITRSLAKNPADRWQTAADFAKALGLAEDQLRISSSGARTPAPMEVGGPAPSAVKVWGLFLGVGALALVLVFGLVRRWGLPSWALALAVVLLAVGALVLAVTGKMEARRAAGLGVSGLGSRFTWRNAALGGLGALGLWAGIAMVLVFRGPGGAAAADDAVVRLAVMPFENRGAAEDAYFVDGMADQVRGKLMSLAGFQITARTSSDQYKASTKTPQQIGKELGVDYLLTSTVTWAKTADGKGRVQVVPELINVKTGAGSWQQSFDGDLTDIFQVQGNIATQVAGALNVALAPKEKEEIAERPTKNLAAYDLYLKAKAVTGNDPASLRQVIALGEQAVALDSGFVEAWTGLAVNYSLLYFNGTPLPDLAVRARSALARARALAPDRVGTHFAARMYFLNVANNGDSAEAEVREVMRLAPNDAGVLRMAAGMELTRGRLDKAEEYARHALRVDPRSRGSKTSLWYPLIFQKKYAEAITLGREILAEYPKDINLNQGMAFIHLMQGDLASARAVIRGIPVSRPEVAVYFAVYQDLYWALEDADQELVLRLPPSMHDDDRAIWATTLMQIYTLRGDRARARAFADTAEVEFRKQLVATPDDPQRNIFLGLALATQGRKAEAIAAATKGTVANPLSKDHSNGAYLQHQLVRVYLRLGEKEKALDLIEELAKIGYVFTPGFMRIDPNFASLKGNPRFEKLIQAAE